MPYNIYCWSCARHYRATNNAENPVCPNCGDSFVEIDDNVMPRRNTVHFMGRGGQTLAASVLDIMHSVLGPAGLENISDQIMQAMNANEQTYSPASEEIRSKLPELQVRDADAEGEPLDNEACIRAEEACPVCHEEFVAAEKVTEMPCSHCFHRSCLMRWLEKQNTCPLCRLELPNS